MIRGLSFAIFVGACFAASAFGVIERRVERRFELSENAALSVDTFSGTVQITEHADLRHIEVVVIQTADTPTEADFDARVAALALDITQRENGSVAVNARYAKPVALSWTTWPPVTLAYEIKVPRRCDVEVRTLDGRIAIGSLQGRVVVENDAGAIFVGEVDGSVNVRSNTGHVGLTAATGEVDVATVMGNITVGRAGGRTRLSSRGGYIEVQRASGEVIVRGDGSSAEVGFVQPITKPADIAVKGGMIGLIVEANAGCTLDAKASVFGKVDVRGELPLEVLAGGEGRSRLKARVNGGGPRIAAKASGGNVVIRAVPPLQGAEHASAPVR